MKLILDDVKNTYYKKTGGDILGKVKITGGGDITKSVLQVKEVNGYKANDGTRSSAELFLNKNSTGNVYLGQGGAFISREGKVYGAVWNDFAEYRKSEIVEPGRVICENGDGTLSLTYKRL
jgi:hypothetical protein